MFARVFALLILFVALAGLRLRYEAAQEAFASKDPLQTLWIMSAYYTNLGNLALALVMIAASQKRHASARLWGALLIVLLSMAVIYRMILRPTHELGSTAFWSDITLHIIAPLLALAWWALFAPKRLKWRDLAFVSAWPILYSIYSLIRGQMTGHWPYHFMDASTRGWAAVSLQLAGLYLMVIASAAALIYLSRLLTRR